MKKILLLGLVALIGACSSDPAERAPGENPENTEKISQIASKTEKVSEPGTKGPNELFGDAILSGNVIFKGKVPPSRRDPAGSFPECLVKSGEPKPADFEKRHDAIRIENGKLQGVFIYVKKGISEKAVYPIPSKAVQLNQKYCSYQPRILGMQKNQSLLMINSDPGLHNVHSMSKNSKNFNLGMPIKNMKMTRTFASEEVMVRFKCDVHPWMAAYVGVLPHPFFAVSGQDGSFEIKRLPEGRYTLGAWHEVLGTQEKDVTVKAGETLNLDFEFTK